MLLGNHIHRSSEVSNLHIPGLVCLPIISICFHVCHMCSSAILRLCLFTRAAAVQAMVVHLKPPLLLTPTHLGMQQIHLQLQHSTLLPLDSTLVPLWTTPCPHPLLGPLLPLFPHLVERQAWPPLAQLQPQLRARAREGPLLVPRALLRASPGSPGSRPRLPLLPGPHPLLPPLMLTWPTLLSGLAV